MEEDDPKRTGIGKGIVLAVLLLLLAAGAARGETLAFALKPGDGRNVPRVDLERPTVAGLTIRVPWSAVNPARGRYNWKPIDAPLAEIARLGKPAKLIIQTGRDGMSPRWPGGAYYQGAPLPWSPEMTAAHETFIAELGRRYGTDPRLVAVHATGPTYPSAEMHPAPGLERVRGYSAARMLEAWSRSLSAYARAFPGKDVCLSLSVQGPAADYVDPVIARAIAILGPRFILQHNALKAGTNPTAPHHRKALEYRARGVRIGFEMACSANDFPERFGSRNVNDGVAIGEAAGADFIDVYPPDLEQLR